MVLLSLLLALPTPALLERPTPTPTTSAPARVHPLRDHLGSGCHLIPAFRRGHVVGARLFGVRPGSPLAALGFENGDILTARDGLPLTTPAAWEALASSPGPQTVAVERRGVHLLVRVGAGP